MIETIIEDYSLKNLNTFGIDVNAKYFTVAKDVETLKYIVESCKTDGIKTLILGGGSNILFTKDFDGMVIKPDIQDVRIIFEDAKYTYIKAGAGIEWDSFVEFCVNNNFYGAENLSYIPGTVGASPIQNIGAYGAEAKDIIHLVEYIDTEDNTEKEISNSKCNFGYRDSIFKNQLKNRAIVTNVIFKLSNTPNFKLNYGEIENLVKAQGEVSAKTIKEVITEVRKLKLPEPKEIGNGGSFFKNPVVDNQVAQKIQANYPDMPSYPAGIKTKIPAGWLIEKAGWKGKTVGNCGVHKNQALVLVNYGGATGKEILQLSKQIASDVYKMFGIEITPEINII